LCCGDYSVKLQISGGALWAGARLLSFGAGNLKTFDTLLIVLPSDAVAVFVPAEYLRASLELKCRKNVRMHGMESSKKLAPAL
jgi:hypothetical protein